MRWDKFNHVYEEPMTELCKPIEQHEGKCVASLGGEATGPKKLQKT